MSKSSTSVTMKVLKLDDKVKAINIFDGGEHYPAVAEEMGVVIFLPVVITVVYIYC
jgi:hypothetical protein